MEKFNLNIKSKNNRTLRKFLELIFRRNELYLIKKHISLKFKQKLMALLKSPHVNKVAQEQFEFKLLKKQLSIIVSSQAVFFVLLKRFLCNLFSDIKIFVNLKFDTKKFSHDVGRIFNPKNLKKVSKTFYTDSRKFRYFNPLKLKYQRYFRTFLLEKLLIDDVNTKLIIWDLFGESILKSFG